MNKTLLVLIIASGFLLIIYANNDIFQGFRRKQPSVDNIEPPEALESKHYDAADEDFGTFDDGLKRVKYIPKMNRTEFNIFIIYTKEQQNLALRSKFELFLKSLLKYTTVELHLHVITDESSEESAETLIKEQINHYRKIVFYTLYDVQDCASKISEIVENMMPLFSFRSGSYYSDALFLLSLGLHKIVDPNMKKAILIDCDVVFRTDVKELFDQFEGFSSENLFALAPELTPVYRHILYKYRMKNPHTNFGNPYYLNLLSGDKIHTRKHLKHGYPGLNSGVVMLHLDRIRDSKLYEENLKLMTVENMVKKYSFKGHLGDQDFFTILGYEFPGLIYRLDCTWNRQLCQWWKSHGYGDVFDAYFHCEGKIKIYHGNCNTRVPNNL